MANTFNLGNGSWAQKTEKLLAYNAENDNYKPLPFDFDRASSATRVNKQGLIETVGTDKPRIDFLNNTKGHLLLEPQSQNTATYSNDFTQGIIFNLSNQATLTNSVLTSNQATSPNGANDAWLFKDDNSGGSSTVFLNYYNTQVNSNDNNVISIFVKKALSNNFFGIQASNFDSSANGYSYFNIKDGTLGTINPNHIGKIEDYGNGWYRCSITFQTTTDTTGGIRFGVTTLDNQPNIPLDGTNGVYLFGLQCEASATQNYVTSYIPTQGSAVSRSAETCNNAGNSTVFNDSEGVLYAELEFVDDASPENSPSKLISINDDSSSNRILFGNFSDGNFKVFTQSSDLIVVSDLTGNNKIAAKYKSGDFSLFVNGVEVGTSTSTILPTGLSVFSFDNGAGGSVFYGKAKDIRIYNTALTDAELQALTS